MKRISRRRVLGVGAAGAAVLGFPAILRAQSRQLVIGGPGGQEAQTRKLLIPASRSSITARCCTTAGRRCPT